ncbi:MAG: hypothetical protein ARM1_0005 [Candidatus Micrarchaeota archaeon]|nr:MAG: hypothetical protein ARM1_0005 [Candidatus Micrarchaeota archaeon]
MSKAKDSDGLEYLREIITKPNYAILALLREKSPRTTKEIYRELADKFTRKTLIISLRKLTLELNVIQPTHIRTPTCYTLGYKINPEVVSMLNTLEDFSRKIKKISSSKDISYNNENIAALKDS